MSEKRMWMVRSGEGGILFEDFKKKGIIAIGWKEVGDLTKMLKWTEIEEKVKKAFPESSKGYIGMTTGQITRFRIDFKFGDYVITYNPQERKYLVGEIVSDYEYNQNLTKFHNIRKVKWLGEIDRDKLSTQTKNSLGSIATIFEVWYVDTKKEILNLLQGKETAQEATAEETAEETIKEDMIQKAHEFIKDKVSALNWDEMQKLVAGILKSMGYNYRISPPGSDRGKDIIASPDGLGLLDPRIVVQVKHRVGQVGAPEIRSFIGALRTGHKGLFVSTGGFSKEARYEADRSNVPLTLVDLDELVNLIIQYYDSFTTETRVLIPLTKIHWPE